MPGSRRMQQTRSDGRNRTVGQTGAPECFFITGTGRCGTMLLARLLNRAANGICEHNAVFRHDSMVEFHARETPAAYEHDIRNALMLRLERERIVGLIYGIASGYCHFALPRLFDRLGDAARYVLILRKPEEFARSALARGFFDPEHPNYCEQIQPHPAEAIAHRWQDATPLEKCLWYWALVNGKALANMEMLPSHLCRVIRMEDFSVEILCDLARFLGLTGITKAMVTETLALGVNISPGSERSGEVNPYSLSRKLGPVETWTDQQIVLLEHYCGKLRSEWYGQAETKLAG